MPKGTITETVMRPRNTVCCRPVSRILFPEQGGGELKTLLQFVIYFRGDSTSLVTCLPFLVGFCQEFPRRSGSYYYYYYGSMLNVFFLFISNQPFLFLCFCTNRNIFEGSDNYSVLKTNEKTIFFFFCKFCVMVGGRDG